MRERRAQSFRERVPASGTARLALACAALATVVLGAAACGTTTSLSPTRTTATPTPAVSPTPIPTPAADAAIVSAYDQAMAAWDAAASIPNSSYPGLTEWLTGSFLSTAQAHLGLLVLNGDVQTGSHQPHPVISGVDDTNATVDDCDYDTTLIVNKATGVPLSPQPWGGTSTAGWDSIVATMVLDSGTWRLSSEEGALNSSCTPVSPSP